jgi:hypothetical protein
MLSIINAECRVALITHKHSEFCYGQEKVLVDNDSYRGAKAAVIAAVPLKILAKNKHSSLLVCNVGDERNVVL